MENQVVTKAGRLRTAIPQVLAVSAQNLILFDLGLCIGFPTMVIPAVQNSLGALSLDDEQTSWFGSVGMICAPVGSVLSGIVLERLGRKLSLLVVNLPFLLSWVLFYFVNTPTGLLVTSVIMGLGMGLVEAPILTYVAEVSQPQLRGMLTTLSELSLYWAIFCMYLVGTVADWRTTAAMSTAVPVISIIALSQVPESPAWLMSRGRTKEAEKSLCWLRGWVEPSVVQEELLELERYYQEEGNRGKGLVNDGFVHDPGSDADTRHISEQESSTQKNAASGNSLNYDNILMTLKAMLKPETLRPLIMVTTLSFMEHWSGMSGSRPYLVQVFEEFGMPIDAHWATVATSLIAIFGVVLCLATVSYCGKRPLLVLSVVGVLVSCTLLGTYAYFTPPGGDVGTNWIPLALFIILFFTHSLALNPMPWMLLSEIFPFRTRSLTAGVAAAMNYVISFAASKTFLDLKASLGLHGVYWLYAAVTALGSVYLVFEFKETEGKSLQDIEDYYKKKPAFFEKFNRVIASTKVMHFKRSCGETVQICEIVDGEQRTQSDDRVPGVSIVQPSLEVFHEQGGIIGPYFEKNTECQSPVGETNIPEGKECRTLAKKEDQREQPVAVCENEALPATKETTNDCAVAHDCQPGWRPLPTESGDERVVLANSTARNLPSLPEETELKPQNENSPDDICR